MKVGLVEIKVFGRVGRDKRKVRQKEEYREEIERKKEGHLNYKLYKLNVFPSFLLFHLNSTEMVKDLSRVSILYSYFPLIGHNGRPIYDFFVIV